MSRHTRLWAFGPLLRRALSGALRGDRGIALPMVLMVYVVLIALVMAFVVAIVASSQVTGTARASVQAQAAAEAGIDAALAEIDDGDPCGISSLPPGEDPKYTVSITCDSASGQVTISSEGEASDGRLVTVEAVYAISSTEESAPTEGGPGLFYTYGLGSRFNSYVFDGEHSEVGIDQFAGAAGVYATTGNMACGSGSVFPSDIYTATGNLQLDGGCVVEGNAYIGGTAVVRGTIDGDLLAPKNVNHTVAGTVGTAPGVGKVHVGGTFTLNNGTIWGNAIAAGTGTTTLGSGVIHGNFTYKGSVGKWGIPPEEIVKGSLLRDTGVTAPTLPEIPGWQDVGFNPPNSTTPPEDWKDAGFGLTTVSGSGCDKWSGNGADIGSLIGTLSGKMIFDIRSCSGGLSTNAGGAQKTVAVNKDVAIIANSWYLSGTKFVSADGGEYTIYFITPDSQPSTPGPQCNWPAQNSEQGNGSTVDPKLAIYIYTPCQMLFNDASSTFRGQVYSGKLDFGGGVKIAFAPRHIPGFDFGEDVEEPEGEGGEGGAGTANLDERLLQRNVN